MKKFFLFLAILAALNIFQISTTSIAKAETISQEPIISPVEFNLLPDKESYFDPEYLILDVELKTGGRPVNAALFGLSFDPAFLQLESIELNQDFCVFNPIQSIDNQNGSLTELCGTPEAKIEDFAIARMKFRKISAGQTLIELSDLTDARIADGLGTELPISKNSLFIEIVK